MHSKQELINEFSKRTIPGSRGKVSLQATGNMIIWLLFVITLTGVVLVVGFARPQKAVDDLCRRLTQQRGNDVTPQSAPLNGTQLAEPACDSACDLDCSCRTLHAFWYRCQIACPLIQLTVAADGAWYMPADFWALLAGSVLHPFIYSFRQPLLLTSTSWIYPICCLFYLLVAVFCLLLDYKLICRRARNKQQATAVKAAVDKSSGRAILVATGTWFIPVSLQDLVIFGISLARWDANSVGAFLFVSGGLPTALSMVVCFALLGILLVKVLVLYLLVMYIVTWSRIKRNPPQELRAPTAVV